MYKYIVSVYRKMGHSNQTRITMKSIFASLEGYAKSIVKNMRLFMGQLTGSPQMPPFLHAMSICELILKQLNTESFHELP